jgi:predicted nucleotidyltransferase
MKGIQNIDKVNPIKRDKVQKGMEFIEQLNTDGLIQKIILFGSASRDDCTPQSDIDLCFVTEETTSNPVFFQMYGGIEIAMDELCDILIYRRLSADGNIKKEIDKNGVIIYEY